MPEIAVGTVLLIAGAAVTVVGLTAAFALRNHRLVRRVLRVTKALAIDPRLPRYVRWPLATGLVLELTPGPDLGVGDALIAIGVLQLLLFHRATLRAILEETRS